MKKGSFSSARDDAAIASVDFPHFYIFLMGFQDRQA
jgi:hypothetical protein